MPGPLHGYRVIEIAGIGPGPFAAMVLADLGAEVVRVDRAGAVRSPLPERPNPDVTARGRRSVGLDLKSAGGVEALLALVERADALIEGFRPGVMERLGAGPDECLARNRRLVYGRMTGWGQAGPYAQAAGHDINYISLAGALAHFGRRGEAPVPPMNMVGDFGGGGMLLALGVVAALLHAAKHDEGQVIDAAMVDGTALLMTMFWTLREVGMFDETRRGENLLDTGAHFYDVYCCADGEYVSIGSLEPQFYAELLRRTGLAGDEEFSAQMDRERWPLLKERLAEVFASKTRDEWCDIMEGSDVCFAPVLRMSEAAAHPHNVARNTFVELDGVVQPAPAPRFSATPGEVTRSPSHPGQHTSEVLAEWGVGDDRIGKWLADGAAVDA